MAEYVSTFQLGSSTVVTLPKKLGIKPGRKLSFKKNGKKIILEESTSLKAKDDLLKVLKQTQGAWAGGTDWEEYQARRKFEIEAAKKIRKIW